MVELKPRLHIESECPNCLSNQVEYGAVFFQGIRVLLSCKCSSCNTEYFQDLPAGHALNFPFKIEKKSRKIYGEMKYKWFADALLQSFNSEPVQISVEKKILKEGFREVIILNCLDFLYGHVLLKLFNAGFYLDKFPEKGLILILPQSFEWLIPSGVAEVWLVNVKLGQARREMKGLDEFVQKELTRFSNILLSPAYSHPDLKEVDISRYTKVQPFSLREFDSRKPVITFIYREDRLWFTNRLEYFIFLVLRKLKMLSYFRWLFPGLQNRRIVSLFRRIKKLIPEAECNVAGLGEYGSFPAYIQDQRKIKITDQVEKNWCELYARSQVVVGVHGSNMLLPSAHAAGFVEILPNDRINNITQDLFCRYDSREMLFLGRLVDDYASPGIVSDHIVQLIKRWKIFNLYSSKENLIYGELRDVRKFEVKDL